jgi:hypothetical protein
MYRNCRTVVSNISAEKKTKQGSAFVRWVQCKIAQVHLLFSIPPRHGVNCFLFREELAESKPGTRVVFNVFMLFFMVAVNSH